ncbi:hypothetical protein [Streptomyces vilmorinianum]|uniref:hypothetical protein n=1 Tax=Streptomyces vilmorinianum TaxID=3051092 RepID=UPI0010FBB6FE|nr:hypothetical protein [Streptomyces vilmorinianum]
MTVRPGYRGTVVRTDEIRTELGVLARLHPLGTRVRHACGREGTITLDQPPHVPGTFDGRPTARSFADTSNGAAMVCASWDNEFGFDRWIVWVPMESVRTVERQRVNRPGLAGGAR